MINCITIVGRLCNEPEIRQTQSGMSVASFRIASDDRPDANGEKKSLFINCSLFGKQTETLSKFFAKGDLIGITGRLTQRTYMNKQNVQVTVTEIIADRIDFIGTKKDKEQQAAQPAPQATKQEPQVQGNNLQDIDVSMDDLPF